MIVGVAWSVRQMMVVWRCVRVASWLAAAARSLLTAALVLSLLLAYVRHDFLVLCAVGDELVFTGLQLFVDSRPILKQALSLSFIMTDVFFGFV